MAPPDIDDYARQFAAVGHPLRLKILTELSERRRQASELAEVLLESPESVRRHLGVLEDGGLVDHDEEGGYRVTRDVEMIHRAAPSIFPPTFPEDELE